MPYERGDEAVYRGTIPGDLAAFFAGFTTGPPYPVTVREQGSSDYVATFHGTYVEMSVTVDDVTGVPDLDKHGVVSGTASEIELTEATTVGLAFFDFEAI